jgi:predicted ATP-dependent serine protease
MTPRRGPPDSLTALWGGRRLASFCASVEGMTTSIRDRARQRTAASLLGRDRELAALLGGLAPRASSVIHVHGVAGIGKTTLLAAFTSRASAQGAQVITLD